MLLLEIFKKFSITDFILAAALLGAAYGIEYGSSLRSKSPNFISFIDQKEKSTLLSYGYVCIFTYGVAPFLIIVLWLITKINFSIFRFLSTYLFSLSFTCLIVSLAKHFCERPLPDTISTCDAAHTSVCSVYLQGHDLYAQFTSFPNRSAAEAMVSGVFLALFLCEVWYSDTMLSAVFKFIPICWSVYMGAFEIITRRANPDDVVAGEIIGALITYFAFQNMKQGFAIEEAKRKIREASSSAPVTNMYT